jgi:hypothetical protein
VFQILMKWKKLKKGTKSKYIFQKKATAKELDELKRKIKIDYRNVFVKKVMLFLIICSIVVTIFYLI